MGFIDLETQSRRGLAMSDLEEFRMIACQSLSHERRTDHYFPAGKTLGEYVRELGWSTDNLHARVSIDGKIIPDAEWIVTEPLPGQSVVVRAIPGNGQNGGKQAAQIVGMIAIAVAAFYTAVGSLQMGAWFAANSASAYGLAAGIAVAGSLALNALIAPPRPQLESFSALPSSQTYSLTGTQNQATPYGRIPRVYGRHRMFPPLAAKPYTTVLGNNQWLNLLFCFGYGPLELFEPKIGDTPLEDFLDIEYDFHRGQDTDIPLHIVALDVEEEQISVELLFNVWQKRTSATNARRLSVDFTFPSGLITVNADNTSSNRAVGFEVQYRKVPPDGTGEEVGWTDVGVSSGTAARATTNFFGNNNDIVFTARNLGPGGNFYTIEFWRGGANTVTAWNQMAEWEQDIYGISPGTIIINISNGSTTANTVKSLFAANGFANSIIQVTDAAGNNGTGAINLPPMSRYPLNGGSGALGTLTATGRSTTLVRFHREWPIEPSTDVGEQFEVRVRRTTTDTSNPLIRDDSFWTTFRTIQVSTPVLKPGMALFELKIKATGQLNGIVDTFNAVVESVLYDWNGAEWEYRRTSNPASVYRDVLQGLATREQNRKDDDELDLPAIQDFHERCTANGFMFNAVIDFQTTVKQLRQDVLAAGRGTFGMRDMKYSVVQDLIQATPVDIITPRTTSNFKWTRRFLEIPHALRVRFVDENDGWRQGEISIFSGDYTEATASIYENADAGLGVTNKEQVEILKKRELTEAALRADDYEIDMDFANLTFTRGDRVKLQHDVILAGLVSARITAVTLNGSSQATAIAFDEPLAMDAVTLYAARYRRADSVQVVQQIVTVIGEWTTVTFTTPIAAGSVPAIGDLVTFGELGAETIDCVVKTIEPGQDLQAHIMLLDYAPAIQTAEDVPLPPYDPQISLPAIVTVPAIYQVQSDETVLVRASDGSLESRILLSVYFTSENKLPVSRIETQFRPLDSDADWKAIFANMGGGTVEVSLTPVEDRETYEIRVRSIDDRTGEASLWTATFTHTVIGKTSPPPDVEMLVLEGSRLRWNYTTPPRDHAGFLVRQRTGTSRLWDGATEIHEQVIRTTDFLILVHPQVQTFLVKAVDTTGNVSTNPAVLTIGLGDLVMDNVMVTTDHRLLGWPGTITNASIVSGDLRAGSSGTFWTTDTAPMWPLNDGDLFWDAGGEEMMYEFSTAPTTDMLDATLKIEIEMEGEWSIEYRTDSTELMWEEIDTELMWSVSASTLMWTSASGYLPAPAIIAPLRYGSYDFRITGEAGIVAAALIQLKIHYDVPDIEESVPDVVIAPGGTRIPITNTYRQIVVVNNTLNFDGGVGVYAQTIDKDPTAGPLVEVFDAAGVSTSGVVDVIIQGY